MEFCCILLYLFFGVIAFVCFVSYKKVPANLDNKREKRFLFAFLHWMKYVARVREYSGFGHYQLWPRMFERSEYVTTPRTQKGVRYYDCKFDGIRVRIYEPENVVPAEGEKRPAIIYYHGGGWCIATVESYHPKTKSICVRTGCVVVSVDYRRAPEHPYPIPLDDCVKATLHCFSNAEKYNIDTSRMAVMGDSAGGNLAAAVCLKLRDMRSEFKPRLQVLIYPITQMLDLQLPSYSDPYQLLLNPTTLADFITFYSGLKNVDRAQMTANEHVSRDVKRKYAHLIEYLPEEFRKGYSLHITKENPELAQRYEKFITDPYVAPLMAESLADLPEAYVWTAGYDVLRDEGIMYAEKLKQHGVPVTRVNKENAMHGVFSFGFPSGIKYRKEVCEFIKQKLNM